MKRKIFDIYESTVKRLEEACGERVFNHKEHSEFGCCWDVILNPNAIVKLYDNYMFIDLAGNKECISYDEFSYMEII